MNTSNQHLRNLVDNLKQVQDSKLLQRVANDLDKPTRRRREVNLSKLNRYTKENDIIIVPGKVLGGGDLNHKITISALNFSQSALEKLNKVGSTIIPLQDLSKESVIGKKVKIIG